MRIMSGDPSRFAIEAVIDEPIDPAWAFGRFRFWVYITQIGDWEDSAAIAACVGWLEAFLYKENYPRFYGDAHELSVCQLCDFVDGPVYLDVTQNLVFDSIKFEHMGMSSFDRYNVLYMKAPDGRERLVWRQFGKSLMQYGDAWFEPGTIEAVARDFCATYRKVISSQNH